ncbi:hypothetical protein JCM10212_000569 [Sporobolomyces blumeae]
MYRTCAQSLLRSSAPRVSVPAFASSRTRLSVHLVPRSYSTTPSEQDASAATKAEGDVQQQQQTAGKADAGGVDAKHDELTKKVDEQSKTIAELKDARLRTLADFENLQKISTREKAQAKDFALTSFAKDLVQSIDILHLALKSIAPEKLADAANSDLKGLHEGVSLTKREIEKCLERHGVKAFDPTGQQFDPNVHEALYQAPVPGKEPGSVLECQEIGYMIKDRLLRPAKVGVVLSQE